MKVLFWNARGLRNEDTRLILKNLCKNQHPDLVLLSEPMIDFDQVHRSYWFSLGFKPFLFNLISPALPNIWCLCSNRTNPVIISASAQQCSFAVT